MHSGSSPMEYVVWGDVAEEAKESVKGEDNHTLPSDVGESSVSQEISRLLFLLLHLWTLPVVWVEIDLVCSGIGKKTCIWNCSYGTLFFLFLFSF